MPTTAPTVIVTTIERRARRGMMPSLYLAPGTQDGTPDQTGLFAEVAIIEGGRTTTLQLSRMAGESGWGIDARWVGSRPVHSNGFGARYLLVERACPALSARLDDAAAEAGL